MNESELAKLLKDNPELGVQLSFGSGDNKELKVKTPVSESHRVQETPALLEAEVSSGNVMRPIAWEIVLEGESCQSWNKTYASTNWQARSTEAKRVHRLVKQVVGGANIQLRFPVSIHMIAYRTRLLDSSNVPLKLYEDGLVEAGILPDDSPKYVQSNTRECRKCKKGEERVILIIKEIRYG